MKDSTYISQPLRAFHQKHQIIQEHLDKMITNPRECVYENSIMSYGCDEAREVVQYLINEGALVRKQQGAFTALFWSADIKNALMTEFPMIIRYDLWLGISTGLVIFAAILMALLGAIHSPKYAVGAIIATALVGLVIFSSQKQERRLGLI